MGKGQSPNKWCWVNWTVPCKRNEMRPPSYTIYKNQLNMA